MLVHVGVPEGESMPQVGDFVTATVTHAGRRNLIADPNPEAGQEPMPSATESKPETRRSCPRRSCVRQDPGLGIAAKALEAKGEQAEIVNADAYQMYKGMDIGTAKAPSPEEQAEVRHHLIDIIEPDDAMSVAISRRSPAPKSPGCRRGCASSWAVPVCTPVPPSTTSNFRGTDPGAQTPRGT